MAVEKSKVIARLKALFPKANLSQKRMDSIADRLCTQPEDDADDSAIDEVINEFNEFLSIEQIARNDDRDRKAAADKNKRKPKLKTETEDDEEDEEEEISGDVPEYVKLILKQNKQIAKELEEIKSGKVTDSKRQQAKAAFEGSEILKGMKPEIKEKWMDRIDLDSETSFEDQAKELETEFSELTQSSADQSNYGGPAGKGKTNGELKKEDVDKVIDRMNI